jgi:cystathionine beta-lyase/cystathionine gamma-synthase
MEVENSMEKSFDTKSVQLIKEDKRVSSKAKPIYQTSAFTFKDLDDLEGFYRGEKDYLYTRVGNPNTDDFANGVALLEGAPSGVATSSGLSAILSGVLAVVKSGDHIIAPKDIYGGTFQLFANELTQFGIEISFVSFEKVHEIKTAIKNNTKLIYSESITNPLLRVEDIDRVVKLAKQNKILTMIDNTFATPYLVQPFLLGADLVVHSATKYIGGHSDVTAGILVGLENLIAKAREKVVNFGTNLSPFEAWLGYRGLKTISVRMERHVKNAQLLAEALKDHPGEHQVFYPNYVSEKGNGAIVSLDITDKCDIHKFFQSLTWIKIVPTLAGVETSVSYPIGTSHRTVPEDIRNELGITKGLIRISVGIEDAHDIIEAFKYALNESAL